MVNINPFNLQGVNLTAPPAPGFNRGTRVTAPNGHYLDFASAVTWGLFADGMPWFINEGVAITARFPAGRTYLGNAIDGYTLNPQLNGSQGYDQRRSDYVAPPAINTITPRKMDVIMSVECMETSTAGPPNAFRDGYFKNQGQAWFTCVTRPPAPGTFSPTVHWPADDVNRLLRPMRVPDIDGMLARLPSYSASGITSPPAWSSFANTIDQPSAAWLDAFYGGGVGAVGDGGYEGGFPRGFTGGAGNYGLEIADEFNRACFAATLNHWSTADKRAFLIRMCQHGNQWIEPFAPFLARQFFADGGHWQWHLPAVSIWLDATNQNARAQALFTAFPGNYDQVFAATASNIANDFVRHTSTTKPHPWRENTLSGVSGLTVTLQDFGDNIKWTGQRMMRTDGQSALVAGNAPNLTITVQSQVTPPWANGDVVYFVPEYTITEGMLLWTAKGTAVLRDFNPSPDSNYLELQSWSGHVLLLRALGIVPPIFENVADFVALCNTNAYPAAAPYAYPDQLTTAGKVALSTYFRQVWDAHWATANAVPSRPGF